HTKAEFIPRLALIYAINENNFLKFLYGNAINRPAFFQQAANLGATTSLDPETIQTFELNYIGSLSSKFTVSLSFFSNMLDKLIIRTLMVNAEGNIVSQFGNGGEMNTNGVELTISTRPIDNFHLEFSCTYQNSKDERPGFKDIEPGYSPNFLGYLKASYFFDEDISIAATGNYVDQMETKFDETLSPPARMGLRVGSYFLPGANLRIRNLFGTGMYINLRGSNLFDKKIHYPNVSNNSIAYKGTIGRGVSFLLTLGWKF
ncbi:MAG: TonB-dependent receptor, partial [bacterium]|nr:TonB-dependent receptor [bacterium]